MQHFQSDRCLSNMCGHLYAICLQSLSFRAPILALGYLNSPGELIELRKSVSLNTYLKARYKEWVWETNLEEGRKSWRQEAWQLLSGYTQIRGFEGSSVEVKILWDTSVVTLDLDICVSVCSCIDVSIKAQVEDLAEVIYSNWWQCSCVWSCKAGYLGEGRVCLKGAAHVGWEAF